MTAFNYQENIKALRAGTALDSDIFIDTIRARYKAEMGKDVICAFLDPTRYDEQGFEVTDTVIKHPSGIKEIIETYSKANIRTLEEDITEQYKDITGEEFDTVDSHGKTSHFQQTLNTIEHNGSFHSTLANIEKNRGSARFIKHNEKIITAITLQETGATQLENLCDIAGWDINDVKLTRANETPLDLHIADHEMGHAVLNSHLGRAKPLNTTNTAYNSHIHECLADSFEVLCAIHDGENKDCIDIKSLTRAYGAIQSSDAEHCTCSTLNQLSERVDINQIQSLASKKEVAEYALKFVLGDKEEGRDPTILSAEAYYEQTEAIKTLAKRQEISRSEGQESLPTPLSIKNTIKEYPDHFTENEVNFLQRHVVPHSENIVHAQDVTHGLMSQERFNDPSIIHHDDELTELAYKESNSAFEIGLQDDLFPVNEDGLALEISNDERAYILNKHERNLTHLDSDYLECGTSKSEALDVLENYKVKIMAKLEKSDQLKSLSIDERSTEFVTPEQGYSR